ncbi:hypothetical protein LCGC14_3105780 [marine sediment metagenome]|uniref:Uncharacterized protein n=1 Tax=marine sediment metagenome TaxID=412755 RepID=A0A0F8W6N2_9ZZZZ
MCKCSNISREGQKYCAKCHAAYMKEWRKTHKLKGSMRKKQNARAYLHTYIKRGKLQKLPCCICGLTDNLEAHHEDYNKPLEVVWFCRTHHLEYHKNLNA